MIELGPGLMLPPPRRPGQEVLHCVLHRENDMPEQVANLGDAPLDQSPRRALNAVKLL